VEGIPGGDRVQDFGRLSLSVLLRNELDRCDCSFATQTTLRRGTKSARRQTYRHETRLKPLVDRGSLPLSDDERST